MAGAEWSPCEAVEYLEDDYDARDRYTAGWYHAPANDLGATPVIYRRGFYQIADDMNDACFRGSCYCGPLPGAYYAMDPPTDAELDAWLLDPNAPMFWGAVDAHLEKHHAYPSMHPNTLL